MSDVQALVDAADEAALLAEVDGLAAHRRWDDLADLARRCRDAVELGKQLWGVAMYIDYRLAWEGPPAHAAATLVPGAGRFALGPLTEVAAGTHTWDDLAPHLTDPITAGAVAQERVIRGEDLTGHDRAPEPDLPLRLASWEPGYALPRYSDRTARFPAPPSPAAPAGVAPLPRGRALAPDGAARALAAVADTWATESTGSVEVAVVEGTIEEAVGALCGEAALARIDGAQALALLQWTGASGGARGRRPGGAAGRFAALWAANALAGLEWPDRHDDGAVQLLGTAIGELEWARWFRAGAERGWQLRLAVADPEDGLAWAIEAVDAGEDEGATGPAETTA